MPVQAGPIGVMLQEHEQGRGYTRAMAEAGARLKEGDREAGRAVVENALGYATLLRQHILKEDQILFPNESVVGRDGGPKERMIEFPDIAGPGMIAQCFDRPRLDPEALKVVLLFVEF